MKLYTKEGHYMQMSMKKYNYCPTPRRGDNLALTFHKCLSTLCVRATPLKPLEVFWWNFIQRKDTKCRCAWRNI